RIPRRTPMACQFCRGRKLKCDGRATCGNCERRGISCTYVPVCVPSAIPLCRSMQTNLPRLLGPPSRSSLCATLGRDRSSRLDVFNLASRTHRDSVIARTSRG
ncbi:hypothetical protein PHLGIDRAFT_78208, partial [Phlebiopsis gigantea 11061_1 CR5-6]